MHVVHAVAKPVIEGQHRIIVLADAEADLWASKFNQEGFGLLHQTNAYAGALVFRGHGKIVDAPPMPVITDHYRRNETVIGCCHPERPVAVGQLTGDVLTRIIPRPDQAANLLERDHRIAIVRQEVPDNNPVICYATIMHCRDLSRTPSSHK